MLNSNKYFGNFYHIEFALWNDKAKFINNLPETKNLGNFKKLPRSIKT